MKTDTLKKKITFGILCALCCLSVAVMIFTVIHTVNDKEAFTPPAFEPAAVTGTPDVPENLGYSPLEVEQGFKSYVCGKLLADGKITFETHHTSYYVVADKIKDPGDIPQTGDNTNLLFYGLVMMFSAGVLLIITARYKKQRKS